jgi:hypothetical protein
MKTLLAFTDADLRDFLDVALLPVLLIALGYLAVKCLASK